MDVIVTDDQRMLQDSTRRYLENRASIAELRKQVDRALDFRVDGWRDGAAQGWVALFIAEAYGGFSESAEGLVDAAIIAEEMGRVVYSGPFLSNCVAAFAIGNAGSAIQKQAVLPGLAQGEIQLAWCFAQPGVKGGIDPGSVHVSRKGGSYVLNGIAANVQDASNADQLLVSAEYEGGVCQFLVPVGTDGIEIAKLDALDLGRSLANVSFTDVELDASALLGGENSEKVFDRQLQFALVLQAAETVGVIDRAMEFTLEYVRQRFAFGRAIGSFQALKHRLADHATQLEGAKAVVARAAVAVQTQAADAAIAASIANSHCSHYGTEIIRDCLHMHGGIGMTWEHDIHFYLRRAVSNEALLGTPAVHYERLCQLAGL